jgi:hypothetical protein
MAKNQEKKVLRKLRKRNYLGEGYIHVFSNNETGEIVNIPCTKAQYEKLGKKNGARFNPTLEGHEWKHSSGGTDKVDTPDTTLGVDEYCVKGNEVVTVLLDADGVNTAYLNIPRELVNENDELDEDEIINLGYGNRV